MEVSDVLPLKSNLRVCTHATPLGCNAVLLTLLATMVMLFKEVEWKLFFCCFEICS